MRILLSAILPVLLLSSCYSYRIFPAAYRNYAYTGIKKKAYVINPELSKELKILEKGRVFELTPDSLDKSALQIRLNPLKHNLACGQPVLVSLVTLGQLPVLLPDRYQYSFDEINGRDTIQRKYELKIASRYWFWDMFAFNKKFQQKAGQTLLAEYYNN